MASSLTNTHPQAVWIWGTLGPAHEHRNEYCRLRHTFRLTSEPVSAPVRLSADNRYILYVNGKLVCRGPARCVPKHQAVDEIDLAPYLRKGRNCLAVLAHHYGESTFHSLERGGWGFFLDGEIRCRGRKPEPIYTGRHWKGGLARAFNRRTARYTQQLGFQEDFDANREPPDWIKPSFNDRDWPFAEAAGKLDVMPYQHPEPRGIPFQREEPARFAAITGIFSGRCGKDYRTREDLALLIDEEKRRHAGRQVIRDAADALKPSGRPATVTPTTQATFHALVIDAGRETCGFVELDVEAAGGEIIDVFYCEHVRPGGDAIVRAANGGIANIADRYRCRPGRQHHQFFSWKGLRYLLVVFRDVSRPLKLHHVSYTFTSYPVERRGSFECSDDLLNRIWETGVYTQQLCMHDAYMDCPWREQAQWWGDARIQWRVNMAAFADTALFERGIRQIAQSQIDSGLTYGVYPCENHFCILPDYTLVWICSIWDYYFYTGSDAPLVEHFDRIVKALGWFERHVGNKYLCGYPGNGIWLFIDWAPLFKAGYNATFTLQYIEGLRTAAKIARHLGRNAEARKWLDQAKRVERAVVRTFWDARGRQFFEGFSTLHRRVHRQVSQHAQSYAIITGVQEKHHDSLADRIVWILRNHDRLFADNADGNLHRPKSRYPIASSFFYGYVLDALLRMRRDDDAIYAIRTLWGRMLEQGATTWFESWAHGPKTYGNSSACHAWSASPTYHLSENVGGVTPAAPGFEKVRIAPRKFDLDHAKVRTPSPRGHIDVEWCRTGDDHMDFKLRIPKRITATLELPGKRRRTLDPGTHRIST